MSKSSKLHTLSITGATPTMMQDFRRCAYKVSRPGYEKCHINAGYIRLLQWSVQIGHATFLKVYRRRLVECQQ